MFVVPDSKLVISHLHAKQMEQPEAALRELLQRIMGAAPWSLRRPAR
jgi:hypothetical protein